MGGKNAKIFRPAGRIYIYISIYTVYLDYFKVVSAAGENFFGLFPTRGVVEKFI